MKSISRFIFIFLSLFSFAMTVHAAEDFTIDPNHSYVLWHASHFGFSSPSGKWLVNGTVMLDKEHPQKSKVDVTINVADLNTGIPEFDKHLKAELFLDVAKYPTATFVSDKTVPTSKTTAKVHGMLTLHGETKPVTLDVKINKVGVSPVTDKVTVGFTASTIIKRSEFGITSYIPGVSDEVKIDIEAEAFKKA